MVDPEKNSEGITFVLTTAFISGFSIFLNKFAVSGIDPSVFTGLKNTLVAILLLSLILAFKEKKKLLRLSKKDWLSLFLIGLTGGSLPFLLFFNGLSQTTAAHASFIHKNMFVFIIPLAAIFLREKLEKKFYVFALILLAGNILFLKVLPTAPQKGDLLIFLATFLWAIENIISKKTLGHLSPKIVAFGRMFFGTLLILLFLTVTGEVVLIFKLNSSQISWIILTSVLLFAYVFTWYHGLKLVRLSLASAILVLGGPITSLLSLIFLGVIPSTKQIIGMILLSTGAILIIRQQNLKKLFRHLRFLNWKFIRNTSFALF